jgi:hypothetical protein
MAFGILVVLEGVAFLLLCSASAPMAEFTRASSTVFISPGVLLICKGQQA